MPSRAAAPSLDRAAARRPRVPVRAPRRGRGPSACRRRARLDPQIEEAERRRMRLTPRGHTSRASPAASPIRHRSGDDALREVKGEHRCADSLMMRACLTLLVSILLLSPRPAAAQGADALPPAIRRALDASHPGWRIAPMTDEVAATWRQSFPAAPPNVLQADYDGNGQIDYAVFIHLSGRSEDGRPMVSGTALAFLRLGGRYQPMTVTGPFEIVVNEGAHLWPISKGAKGWDYEESRAFVFERDASAVHSTAAGRASTSSIGAARSSPSGPATDRRPPPHVTASPATGRAPGCAARASARAAASR